MRVQVCRLKSWLQIDLQLSREACGRGFTADWKRCKCGYWDAERKTRTFNCCHWGKRLGIHSTSHSQHDVHVAGLVKKQITSSSYKSLYHLMTSWISFWIILDFDPSQVTEEMVSPLLAMGFDEKDSINALVKFKGDAAGAIEALTSGADLTPPSKKGKKVRINRIEWI